MSPGLGYFLEQAFESLNFYMKCYQFYFIHFIDEMLKYIFFDFVGQG